MNDTGGAGGPDGAKLKGGELPPMPDGAGDGWTAATIFSCTILGTTGFSSYLGLPAFLGALGGTRGLGEQALGWVGSSELLGLLVGSLLTARLIGRIPARVLALAGILTAIAGQIATLTSGGLEVIVPVRLMVGVGGGICYALAMACLASSASASATRNFSLFGLGLVTLGSIELVALPWLVGVGGLPAVLIFLVLTHASAALFLPWLPSAGAATPVRRAEGRDPAYTLGWVSLFATLIFSIGATSFWAYVERLGTGAGLTSLFVGNALNIGNLAGFATCLLTYRIERRFGAAKPQVLTLCLTAVIFATWPLVASKTDFALRAFLYFQLLTVSQILQQSILAKTDVSGRQAAMLPAAQGAGQAIGPIFGGMLLALGGFRMKLIGEALTLAVTAVIFLFVYRRLARTVRSRPMV